MKRQRGNKLMNAVPGYRHKAYKPKSERILISPPISRY
jgi:hypothetical protein